MRPLVRVFNGNKSDVSAQVPLPAVLASPIRLDIVQFVHSNLAKNSRQAYAVNVEAGHQTSAISWGTGRAVSRIPRVSGGGTHRAGQGAFGNMCRGGRMFAPTKTWRRWHRKVNVNQKRFAVTSALAASALAPLVLARGHKVEQLPEVPLVVADAAFNDLGKTKAAVALLKALDAYDDVQAAKDSHRVRAGKGKARNRRYVQRRGPLVIHNEKHAPLGFRNLPGIETANVTRLNLLQLAPGGHLGRFIIWTQSAFQALDAVFGTLTTKSTQKHGYSLPYAKLTNPDLSRIINSDEVQSALRPIRKQNHIKLIKKNPLKNWGVMVKLNPHAPVERRHAILANEANRKRVRFNELLFGLVSRSLWLSRCFLVLTHFAASQNLETRGDQAWSQRRGQQEVPRHQEATKGLLLPIACVSPFCFGVCSFVRHSSRQNITICETKNNSRSRPLASDTSCPAHPTNALCHPRHMTPA